MGKKCKANMGKDSIRKQTRIMEKNWRWHNLWTAPNMCPLIKDWGEYPSTSQYIKMKGF